MNELRQERKIIKAALATMVVDAFVYEDDIRAQSRRARDAYLAELEKCDLYVGIFWNQYGEFTIDEYENAVKTKDCLIFEKRLAIEDRDPRLTEFLQRIGDVTEGYHTIERFKEPQDIKVKVKEAVALWLAEKARAEKKEKPIPRLLAYRCDREDQVIAVKESVSSAELQPLDFDDSRGDETSPSIVCILHGPPAECIRELVEVLIEHSIPTAVSGEVAPDLTKVWGIPVPWPNEKDEQKFRASLRARISNAALKRVTDLESVAAALDEHMGPVLVHTYIEASDLGRNAERTLERFVKFWNDWPRRGEGELFFAVLCILYETPTEPKRFRWFGRSSRSGENDHIRQLLKERRFSKACPDVKLSVAPELPAVRKLEAQGWADLEEVAKFCPDRDIAIRQRIAMLYEDPKLKGEGDAISMSTLAPELEQILRELKCGK